MGIFGVLVISFVTSTRFRCRSSRVGAASIAAGTHSDVTVTSHRQTGDEQGIHEASNFDLWDAADDLPRV